MTGEVNRNFPVLKKWILASLEENKVGPSTQVYALALYNAPNSPDVDAKVRIW